MIWRKIGDALWIGLFLTFAVWYVGWAFGYEPWHWSAPSWLSIAAVFGVFEALVLTNKASRDTLSERMRLLARARTLIPLVWGIVGGAGMVVASTWPMIEDWQIRGLRVFSFVVVLAPLSGHFFRPPRNDGAAPRMERAALGGVLYGWCCAAAACTAQSPEPLSFCLLAAALAGFHLGAKFFALRD